MFLDLFAEWLCHLFGCTIAVHHNGGVYKAPLHVFGKNFFETTPSGGISDMRTFSSYLICAVLQFVSYY